MLFMIVAEHTTENCPGGMIRPDKQFMAKVDESMKKSGVTIVEGYLDAPGHIFYFIVEANDNKALNNAVEQFRLVGKVRFSPVMKFSEAVAWFKNIGIQK
jgi:uncharacterized protein with GYD domain